MEEGRRNCDLDIHCTGVLVINGNKYVDALDVYLCEGEFIPDTEKKNLVFQKGKPKFDTINFRSYHIIPNNLDHICVILGTDLNYKYYIYASTFQDFSLNDIPIQIEHVFLYV